MPVIIKVDLQRLVTTADALSQEFLYASVLGKRDVGANIKKKSTLISKRHGVAAVVAVLVVHDRSDPLLM